MGLILAAKCECGIDNEVRCGSGMVEGNDCLPAWCGRCQSLMSVQKQHGPPHCEACKAPVEVISLDLAAFDEVTPAQPLLCPRCRNTTLQLTCVGLWD